MEQSKNREHFKTFLGQYKTEIDNAGKELTEKKIVERIWQKDFTVWSDKPDEITNRLGWLISPEVSLSSLDEINSFVSSVCADGFTHALLLGMGGSSLAPEVFAQTFGVKKGFLDLSVLDSTDPGAVLECSRKFDPAKTLYIVSTKSGGTVETFSFMKFFYNQVQEKLGKEKVGNHFVAITDPGSGLETTAKQLKFRKIFLNDPNIGGRYSALSLFGVVPAALIGMNVKEFLGRAEKIALDSKVSNYENDSATLGVIVGELAKFGKDKVTFITSPQIEHFGIWVEQLIAESTGKVGKGILPVVGEEILSPEYYSNDRVFVYMHLSDDHKYDSEVLALKNSNHPVVEIILDDVYNLGAEMFRWEIATAVASWRIGIQPFDQPNVESAKILARKMVQEYKEKGKLPELKLTLSENGISVYGDVKAATLQNAINDFLSSIENGSYVSIQAYLKPEEKTSAALQTLRTKIQKKYKVATTIGYGPRFLHSTGQLHKGDAGNGLFIQFISDMPEDANIPDEAGESKSSMSFGVLKNAQALGDREALIENKRKTITIKLGLNTENFIQLITEKI